MVQPRYWWAALEEAAIAPQAAAGSDPKGQLGLNSSGHFTVKKKTHPKHARVQSVPGLPRGVFAPVVANETLPGQWLAEETACPAAPPIIKLFH